MTEASGAGYVLGAAKSHNWRVPQKERIGIKDQEQLPIREL